MSMEAVKTEVEIDKMKAEIDKIRAETRKVLKETGVLPFVAGAGFMAAATGLAALIFKLLGMG